MPEEALPSREGQQTPAIYTSRDPLTMQELSCSIELQTPCTLGGRYRASGNLVRSTEGGVSGSARNQEAAIVVKREGMLGNSVLFLL